MSEMIKAPQVRSYNKSPVFCVTNGRTYLSVTIAALMLGICRGNLTKHLKGERKHVGGYVFTRPG